MALININYDLKKIFIDEPTAKRCTYAQPSASAKMVGL